MSAGVRIASFRERLRRGESLLGTFVKMTHPSIVEILGAAPLDCLCIDAEHAPFDRRDLDVALLAARAADMPALVAQIEDAEVLDQLDAIAKVEGIDALFVGRMDLTVSLGANSANDPAVVQAVRGSCAAARRHDRAVGMFTPSIVEAGPWIDAGASFFLLGSDQQWMLQGARDLATTFGSLRPANQGR